MIIGYGTVGIHFPLRMFFYKKAIIHMLSYGAIEADLTWRKPKRCASRECVEVTELDGSVLIRDSAQPGAAVLRYSADEWRSFVRQARSGQLDALGR